MKIGRLAALSLVVVVSSSVAGGVFGQKVLGSGSRLSDQLRLYTAILGAIEDQYVDEVKSDRLVSSSIREMLRTLDPHSNFLETREFGQLQERQRGSYYGLGITVQAIEGRITVVSLFEGTPAHKLGLRTGDVISRVEGEDALGLTVDDAVKKLRGPKGSSVRITITRPGYETPLEFTVIRDEIPLHSVPYSFMATKKTGYIRLQDFNETTACRPQDGDDCERELERALRQLAEKGATSFILDIRDNPGGLLDQAFAVSNLFLKKGQLVVYTRGRSKRDEMNYVTETESRWAAVPLVVLVSRHSASASEIVAGAIQDHDRGLIVGETTFGKGLVQTILPLRNSRGYALALTTARYYTPSGRLIQRDYGQTALEDYVAPRDRKSCEEGSGDAKLTDSGRRVFGGDGITPDYCVEPEAASKFVSQLIARQAFLRFSRRFAASEATGVADIAGTGSRSEVKSEHLLIVDRAFDATPKLMDDFRASLKDLEIDDVDDEFEANREPIRRLVVEEVLRQVFGEGEARRRAAGWDPQLQRALELMPRAELLQRDPRRFVAEREAELKVAERRN
ncbi:MAG: S41 family peptidase [Vicinamibacteria bacterium]